MAPVEQLCLHLCQSTGIEQRYSVVTGLQSGRSDFDQDWLSDSSTVYPPVPPTKDPSREDFSCSCGRRAGWNPF